MSLISDRLKQLRNAMRENNIHYYFVPSSDAHNNEYVPTCWQRRPWVSGFTGSAGDALIGEDNAYLWTDPRYFLQAKEELDSSHYALMKNGQAMAPPIDTWLAEQAPDKNIGVDPRVISAHQATRWEKTLAKANAKLISIDQNLVDNIWSDRESLETHPIQILDTKLTGEPTKEKLIRLRHALKEAHADAHVITMLDAIAWLFNIRGTDVAYNPLVISYAIVTQKTTMLFVDLKQVQDKAYFENNHIELRDYNSFQSALNELKGNVLIDPKTASWWVQQNLSKAHALLQASPITLMKACKNTTEQKGIALAHKLDAIAECRFFHWLDNNWKGTTELAAAEKLDAFRLEHEDCVDLSFNTISGFGDHGAIIHYSVSPETDREITDQSLYLVDSGGQYPFGTTDITRTIHLGTPNKEQKHHYTLVLKGHLALRHAIFPAGTCGEHLDVLARLPLWKEGLNYGHGTGHGVGCFLCVHEGPQRISAAASGVPFQPGMITSNEPGVYIEGLHGIRIENLCVVIEKCAKNESLTQHGPFYGFKDLTLVPYALNLIDTTLLTLQEIEWINAYHQHIFDTLKDSLDSDVKTWLKNATKPISG